MLSNTIPVILVNSIPVMLAIYPLLFYVLIMSTVLLVKTKYFNYLKLILSPIIMIGFLVSFMSSVLGMQHVVSKTNIILCTAYPLEFVFNIVMFTGGLLLTSGDIYYKDSKLYIRRNSITVYLADKLDVSLYKRSLCNLSWTVLLLILLGSFLGIVVTLSMTIAGIFQVLFLCRKPTFITQGLFKRYETNEDLSVTQSIIGKYNLPFNPILLISMYIGTLKAAESHNVVWVIIPTILYLINWLCTSLCRRESKSHPVLETAEKVINYALDKGSNVKENICPTICLGD